MTDNQIIKAMGVFGGSFVQLLAELWSRADDQNRARLKAAFPEYWDQYAELAELHAKRQDAAC